MSLLQSAKLVVMGVTSLGKDALHVYVGLAVLFGVVILFKKSLKDWQPLAAVLFVALAGEIWDVVDSYAHGRSGHFDANWKDVLNTLFWPSFLFVLARFTKVLKRQ